MGMFWYIFQLYDLSYELEGDTSPEAIEAVNHIEKLIYMLREENAKMPSMSFLSDYLNDFYNDAYYSRFIWKEIKKMALLDKNSINTQSDPKKLILTKDDMIELLDNFFKNSTNQNMYNIFNTILRSKDQIKVNRRIKQYNSDCIYVPYHQKLFIRLCPEKTIDDIVCLAHEVGHGIEEHINPDWTKYDNVFSEIISTFFEILSYYYFTQSKEFSLDTSITAANRMDFITFEANLISNDLTVIKNLHSTRKESLNVNIKSFIRKNLKYALEMKKDNNLANYNYIIGYIIAIELFYIYLEDQDKAFYIITKISEISPTTYEYVYYEKLLKLGIKPNLHSMEYQMQLKRNLK